MSGDARYDGETGEALAVALSLPRVVVADVVDSTMDEAHTLAIQGAPAGTMIISDAQRRGRGRTGKAWASTAGQGIWFTLLERPSDSSALEVLSLRVGMAAAQALDLLVGGACAIRLKWPNDLMTTDGKLGGILVEARWRDARPEWVAIGIGVNVTSPPGVAGAASLGGEISRLAVLRALVPAMRAAAGTHGGLSSRELADFDARDWARGRRAVAPARGLIRGITRAGALLVEGDETLHECASGSLILEETPQ